VSEPWGMLDDAALPERYDVDRVHVMARDPRMLFVYWELTERGRAAALAALPGAARAQGIPRPALRLRGLGDDIAPPPPGAAVSHELVLLVDQDVSSAYIEWPGGGPRWVRAELGMASGGVFAAACSSPLAPVPPADPSAALARATSPWRHRETAQ